jgi:hypothetical protein
MKGRLSIVIAALAFAAIGFAQQQRGDGFSGSAAANFAPVSVKVGEAIPAGDLRYRVLRISSNLKEYVQRYDQRRLRLQPAFESDQLVVVELEVENVGEQSTDPTSFGFKLIDSDGGVSSHGLIDARQQSGVVAAGIPGAVSMTRSAVAPAGKAKLALVFSIPPSARAKGMEVYTSSRVVTQGAIVDMPGFLVAKAALEKG